MNKPLELEKVDRALKEATIRHNTLLAHLHRLENEIFSLCLTEKQLIENIEILKTENLITVANEFRKIKAELDQVRNKIVFARIDKSNCLKNIDNSEKILHKCKEDYAMMLLDLECKVIRVNFGSKNGQE